VPEPGSPKPGLQWHRIEDFTPGIYSQTDIGSTGSSSVGAVGNFPPGSADPYATYNCVALPTGGLGPLPAMAVKFNSVAKYFYTGTSASVQTVTAALSGGTASITTVAPMTQLHTGEVIYVTGLGATGVPNGPYTATVVGSTYIVSGASISSGAGYSGGASVAAGSVPSAYLTMMEINNNLSQPSVGPVVEIISGWEWDDGTNHMTTSWSSAAAVGSGFVFSASVNALAGFAGPPSSVLNGTTNIFGNPYPYWTRMWPVASVATVNPGYPALAFPQTSTWITGLGGPVVYLYAYPNPTNLSAFAPLRLSIDGGQVITHQNRVLALNAGFSATWPQGAGTWNVFTNEQINYTDPPNSTTFGYQNTFFGVEEPFGYGAMGSISAGELFLVKQFGGGLVVSGDIVNPTATYFPGVQPTFGIYGRCDSGSDGLFYGSYQSGMWLWNGGNTSQKISEQLDDNFFYPAAAPPAINNGPTNYGFYVRTVAEKMYVSNNWVYDMMTNSWWTYYPRPGQDPNNTGYNLYYYGIYNASTTYAAPLQISNADTTWLLQFNQTAPAQYWSWKSNPIMLQKNPGRTVDAREVVARFSVATASASPIATISVFANGHKVGQVTTNPGQITATPTDIRLPIGRGVTAGSNPYAAQDLTVQVYATDQGYGNQAAPIMHYIDIAYRERTHEPTTGVAS
jgi:hypothetical protein